MSEVCKNFWAGKHGFLALEDEKSLTAVGQRPVCVGESPEQSLGQELRAGVALGFSLFLWLVIIPSSFIFHSVSGHKVGRSWGKGWQCAGSCLSKLKSKFLLWETMTQTYLQ